MRGKSVHAGHSGKHENAIFITNRLADANLPCVKRKFLRCPKSANDGVIR